MAFKYQVYKTQRVCLVRFRRQGDGIPKAKYPGIDDRGCFRSGTFGIDRGPVVSLMQSSDAAKPDDDVHVQLLRERIDKNAPLFATSSDPSVMTVGNSGELPKDYSISLQIRGIKGSGTATPNIAQLRIHYGSPTGVVIGELSVWVFTRLPINITPHRVTLTDANNGRSVSRVDINAVIKLAEVIWKPYGIAFRVSQIRETSVTVANAASIPWSQAEFERLFTANFQAGTINAYFVKETDNNVLGYGVARAFLSTYGLTNPGILMADQTTASGSAVVTSRVNDIYYFANDVAHEIGHFLKLAHVDNRSPDSTSTSVAVQNNFRDDTWARRNLMHVYNESGFTNNRPPGSPRETGYAVAPNSGGMGYRGALVTLKDLYDQNNASVNHVTDPQYLTARTTANSSTGLY